MTDMVEMVARAIAGHFGPVWDDLPADKLERRKAERQGIDFNGNDRSAMLEAAAAAIEAMREPTHAMTVAGYREADKHGVLIGNGIAGAIFHAMLSAALAPLTAHGGEE